eukprot:764494-Hanusia_phi.AAC.2
MAMRCQGSRGYGRQRKEKPEVQEEETRRRNERGGGGGREEDKREKEGEKEEGEESEEERRRERKRRERSLTGFVWFLSDVCSQVIKFNSKTLRKDQTAASSPSSTPLPP